MKTAVKYDDYLPFEELSRYQQLERKGQARAFLNALSHDELDQIEYLWDLWARPKQLAPPGSWTYWLLLAGRGFGKTRALTEWANGKAYEMPGSQGAIVAPTAADARDVMVEGHSGILACAPPDRRPNYEPSKRRLTWPNGTRATLFSADEPDRLRGPQFHWAAADELAAWRYMAAWDMLQFGLRLGDNPQCAVATTPRPIQVLRDLIDDETCEVTKGTTYENYENLAGAFFRNVIRKYEGTRLGRQELLAKILEDVPGALWTRDLLDRTRVTSFPPLFRKVVAVDPHSTTGSTGIVVAGIARYRGDIHGFILDDVTSEPGVSPAKWGLAAVAAYHKHQADAIVGEINHGGDMIENVIRNVEGGKKLKYIPVRASRGKYTRAEPISTLFEQGEPDNKGIKHGRAHMVGFLGKLEDELCTWLPGEESPNRLDAMVWALTELMLEKVPPKPLAQGKAKGWMP